MQNNTVYISYIYAQTKHKILSYNEEVVWKFSRPSLDNFLPRLVKKFKPETIRFHPPQEAEDEILWDEVELENLRDKVIRSGKYITYVMETPSSKRPYLHLRIINISGNNIPRSRRPENISNTGKMMFLFPHVRRDVIEELSDADMNGIVEEIGVEMTEFFLNMFTEKRGSVLKVTSGESVENAVRLNAPKWYEFLTQLSDSRNEEEANSERIMREEMEEKDRELRRKVQLYQAAIDRELSRRDKKKMYQFFSDMLPTFYQSMLHL